MKESIISKKILTVMFGLLFVGGATAILGIYRSAKSADRPLGFVVEEQDGETFVYGAHA